MDWRCGVGLGGGGCDEYVNSVLGQVTMTSSSYGYLLEYYSGDTARLRDAKPIHLDGSQEMSAADITIPVSKLHVVTGQIVEAGSGSMGRRNSRWWWRGM